MMKTYGPVSSYQQKKKKKPEHLKKCENNEKRKTITVFMFPYLNILEAHSHQKVSKPVGETSNSDGRRPGTLTEEFCHNEPWDWAWSDLEKCHKTEDGDDADV